VLGLAAKRFGSIGPSPTSHCTPKRSSLPRGVSYELIYDSRQDHPSGNVTWSGYLKDYGDDYRAVITFGSEGVSGRILTPDGEFLIESDADGEWLIDTQAAGLKAVESSEDDALIPLPEDSVAGRYAQAPSQEWAR